MDPNDFTRTAAALVAENDRVPAQRVGDDGPVDEPRYTLAEARLELARRQCSSVGHDWCVVADGSGQPVRVACEHCGQAHEVVHD